MTSKPFSTWCEVNLSIVESNTRLILKHAAVPLMAVVKDQAYGHGAVQVAQAALNAGASWLGVARVHEGVELRQAGLTAPTLVLGAVTPQEIDEAIAYNLTLTLYNFEIGNLVQERATSLGKKIDMHLKVDTGMGRAGVLPSQILALAQQTTAQPMIQVSGIYTHFARADHKPTTEMQINNFNTALKSLETANLRPHWAHAANSGGTLAYPNARFDMVRSGSNLTGLQPAEWIHPLPGARHALTWKTYLASVKQLPAGWGIGYDHKYTSKGTESIGIIPVGFGDGFRRLPGNEVLVNGKRTPIIGSLCMDQCMILLEKPLPVGTEVVIIGKQGDEEITVDDVATRWDTVHVDVLVNINARVPRLYMRD